MGLDTTHNAWHGPYSSFNRFRKSLMLAFNGSNLSDYQGYGGDTPLESIKEQGLYVFFNHSDCDGEISPSDCKAVADDLLQILPNLSDEYTKEHTLQFINGCMLAYNNNETLEFH